MFPSPRPFVHAFSFYLEETGTDQTLTHTLFSDYGNHYTKALFAKLFLRNFSLFFTQCRLYHLFQLGQSGIHGHSLLHTQATSSQNAWIPLHSNHGAKQPRNAVISKKNAVIFLGLHDAWWRKCCNYQDIMASDEEQCCNFQDFKTYDEDKRCNGISWHTIKENAVISRISWRMVQDFITHEAMLEQCQKGWGQAGTSSQTVF